MEERSGFGARLKHAWNAFVTPSTDPRSMPYSSEVNYGGRPDRTRYSVTNERSIISSILTRLSIDVAAVDIRHVRTDDQGRYIEDINSAFNSCLTVEANTDQAARHFRQDIAMTLFDEGVAAIVPVDTTLDPSVTGGFDIQTLRVGRITAWFPQHIRVNLYNEAKGRREDIVLEKKYVAVVENPLYSVMNEPNSTLKRLVRKLGLLDAVDEQSASGKLDLIIQLPYVIKSEARREQADQRRKDIEFQLKGSQYGVAYTDGTEKITQLNRPVENNLMKQVEYLVEMLYGQLGLTPEVMNGTADEKVMLNYNNRTIEPIVAAIVEAMRRSFLTKTARTQKQTIMYFRDPFKLLPLSEIAEIADAFARNEILSSNELRQLIGFKPADDPNADKLRNSNMPQPNDSTAPVSPTGGSAQPTDVTAPASSTGSSALPADTTAIMADSFDQINAAIDDAFQGLG
jgi:hypothetical protein